MRYFVFRSRLMRLTMPEAVRSSCRDDKFLGTSYADQITWRDLASTRNTVPVAPPKLDAGLASLFTGSESMPTGWVSSALRLSGTGLAGSGAGLAGSGLGNNSSNLDWNESPMRSVRMASASLGSVTTWKTWSLVNRFARYWSIPFDIFS